MAKKTKGKDKNKNIDSYFYSLKKDKKGNFKFDYKSFFKSTYKYSKWTFFLFLLVVSLWGCFQSFVVSTNPQLGSGLELYQNKDDVYSNTYTYDPVLIIKTEELADYVSEEENTNLTDSENESYPYVPNLLFYTDVALGEINADPKSITDDKYVFNTTGYPVFSLATYSAYINSVYLSYVVDDPNTDENEQYTWYNKYRDPAYQCQENDCEENDFITGYQNALNAFLLPNGVTGAKWYLVPTPNQSSIAPTNISYQASQQVRPDNWADAKANGTERNDNAGWSLSVTTYNDDLTNAQSQTRFKSDSAPANATIEEYFITSNNEIDENGNWLFAEAGAYYQNTDTFITSQSSNNLTPYAIASAFPAYGTAQESEITIDQKQADLATKIASHGLVAKNSEDLNAKLGSIEYVDVEVDGETQSERIYTPGTLNNNQEQSLVFASPIPTEPYIPDSDTTDETDDAIEEQNSLYYIPFGGLYVQTFEGDVYLGSTFDEAAENYGAFKINQQIDNRHIIISWSDAWEYGPFYGLFVWPIAQFSLWVETWISWSAFGAWSAILGTIFIVLTLRLLSTLLTVNKFTSQAKTQEIQLKTAEVNAKYAIYDKKNKEMQRKKQAETMAIYKKEGVSPYGSIGTLLLTMPIFLSMWRVISALPAYKIGSLAGIGFGQSAFSALFGGAAAALLLIIPIVFVQYVSLKAPTWLAKKRKNVKHLDEKTKKAMKKSNRISNIMGIVFILIGLTIPSLLGIYWVVSGVYTIFISLLQHFILLRQAENHRLERLGTTRKEEIAKGNILSTKDKVLNVVLVFKKEKATVNSVNKEITKDKTIPVIDISNENQDNTQTKPLKEKNNPAIGISSDKKND